MPARCGGYCGGIVEAMAGAGSAAAATRQRAVSAAPLLRNVDLVPAAGPTNRSGGSESRCRDACPDDTFPRVLGYDAAKAHPITSDGTCAVDRRPPIRRQANRTPAGQPLSHRLPHLPRPVLRHLATGRLQALSHPWHGPSTIHT